MAVDIVTSPDCGLLWRDLDSGVVGRALLEQGYCVTGEALSAEACEQLAGLYEQRQRFRSQVQMQRVNFGRGQYRYFAYPLPEGIQRLREAFYRKLVPVANHWAQCLGLDRHWPSTLGEFLRENHLQGQQLPTPLMLDYGPGDYNCLHQDKYGEAFFPFQVLIQLNRPGKDFTGGEFVLVENQARRQSRVMVVPLARGQAVVFPNSLGVQRSSRGYSRTQIRHGVSQIMTGHRRSLGLIFHDALK